MNASLPLAGRIEILRQRLVAIAERMGETLARTAFSANIKERRDHSCALFDADGHLLAQAAHIPVHLGSMAVAVEAARRAVDMQPGDAVILNDPYSGGTHLPDITLVSPVHRRTTLVGYVANRAHHADVGGAFPSSMGAGTTIHQEGLRIPPLRWMRIERGELREIAEVGALIRANVRTPDERMGDLNAQLAANEIGRRGLIELLSRYNADEFAATVAELFAYAQRRMRAAIAAIPDGEYRHVDYLEGDGVTDAPIPICATVRVRGDEADVDFTGTSPAVAGCVNCPFAVTQAAVNYVFACLAGRGLPHNAGMDAPIRVSAPPGCLVNAAFPSAVAAGNVETSQRIVDVLFGALAQAIPERIPAASAGTMSSLSLGGVDARTGTPFTYYETIGGGSGASAAGPGESGIQTHMTNTRNTPIEALESAFPVRVRRYALAKSTGGAGRHRGGDGIVRELVALSPMTGALLADRHRTGPSGRAGGGDGQPGRAILLRGDRREELLRSKGAFEVSAGDAVIVQTPGGGGWGES